MAVAGLAPSWIDWRLQAAVGLLAAGAAVLFLVRFRERALVFALAVSLLEVGLLVAGRGLIRPFVSGALLATGRAGWLQSFLVILLPAGAGIAIVSWRGWWLSCGFTPPSQWRRWRLLWLLGLLLVLPALSLTQGIHVHGGTLILATLYLVIATGLEEVFYRGIVLRATISKGVLPAVLISSLLFGVSHVNNLFTSSSIPPVYVLEQAFQAALVGIFLAAVRLRMNAIWPTMAAHAAYDLFPLVVYWVYAFSYRPTLVEFWWSTGFGAVFAAIGLFLIRGAKPSIIPTEFKTLSATRQ
jgi:membrane protease YdiL (CAAX protease family)